MIGWALDKLAADDVKRALILAQLVTEATAEVHGISAEEAQTVKRWRDLQNQLTRLMG